MCIKVNPIPLIYWTGLSWANSSEGKRWIGEMWICLFTCLTVRAVHLELVRGLSAEHFLECLRRFVSRKGRPYLVISDNAPHFKLVKICHRSPVKQSLPRVKKFLAFFSGGNFMEVYHGPSPMTGQIL